ncbi:MAG: ornithine cyclodeaminase family protein [Methanoculleaceae archaeon]
MKYYTGSAGLLPISDINRAIEEVFALHGRGDVQMPPKIYVNFEEGDFRTMPAYIPHMEIAGVKVVNVHPENRSYQLPTVMALTILLSPNTGIPEAIINATELTDLRTGAAGAVAATYLSPARRITLGVVGSGDQAKAQVNAIAEECDIAGLRVWSRNDRHADAFARRYERFNAETASIKDVCDCDVLVTTTPSRTPLVKDEWITEGMHINAIGADAPGKQELDPAILDRATVFVDEPEQAIHSGEVNVPITAGRFRPEQIAGTLGEVVLGSAGRSRPDEITVFDSTGLAIQDLAIARIAVDTWEGTDLPFP